MECKFIIENPVEMEDLEKKPYFRKHPWSAPSTGNSSVLDGKSSP